MSVINTNLLKSKMALKGYSRKKLSIETGLSIHTINNLFNRDFKPSHTAMLSISEKLNLSPLEMIEIFFTSNLPVVQVNESVRAR